MKNPTCASLVAAALLGFAPALVQAQPDQKIVVKTEDDLPRHTYKIEGKPSEFVQSDKPFAGFLAKVKADAASDLAKYDIKDPTTLQRYYQLQQAIALLEGRDEDALACIEKVRGLESKDAKRLTTGLATQSIIAAKKAGAPGTPAFNNAFKEALKARTKDLPWETVREIITQTKAQGEMISKNLIIGSLQSALDPVAAEHKGELGSDLAWGLVNTRMLLDKLLPIEPLMVEVYGDLIKSHETAKADLWTPRLVTLTSADKGSPVVVAIWDSGVDATPYTDRLWTNPKETVNGKDDDGNGFVDDIHGIAFDMHANPSTKPMGPIDQLRSDRALVQKNTKGMMDMEAGIDSPDAAALKKYMSSLGADKVGPFIEDLTLFGEYIHGTHVAGIASAGNPFIQLLAVRIEFDYHQIPAVTPSVEEFERDAKAKRDSVAYMKKAGVRVCNMSWGGSRAEIESDLEKKGVGKTPAERAELSRKLFKIERDALEDAMKSAPEILFVAAAGNSDNDNAFAELIPSGLSLPNMITVGAVDQTLKPTDFTTFGKGVKLYSNGFEVESYIPGGEKMKLSGTSMAAPNTVNLAAKLLALNPKLTTAQVIDLIDRGADPMAGQAGRKVINPKKSIELLKAN